MGIIGFNYTKISAEKKKSAEGNLRINNNAKITNVKTTKISMGTEDKEGMVFEFQFTAAYEPGIAQILMEGAVIATETNDATKKIIDEWKKNKKVSSAIAAQVINHILARCTIQAMIMSKEMNLPPPIRLPKIEEAPATPKKK